MQSGIEVPGVIQGQCVWWPARGNKALENRGPEAEPPEAEHFPSDKQFELEFSAYRS